jgi:hypothetical protein
MLSLFAVPKAFVGHAAIIQHNAIASWTRLSGVGEIVLFGKDQGVAEAAARHGVRWEPDITYNQFGTPVLSHVFTRMNVIANFPVLAFINADIILLTDFSLSVRKAMQLRARFLLVSSRFNCQIEQPLIFHGDWDSQLRVQVRNENRMYPSGGSDIFVFPRTLFVHVPDFSVGRGYWDNWLMRDAREMRASLIDATATLTAVHQEHHYDHIPGIPFDTEQRSVLESDEGRHNLMLAGGQRRLYTVFDATEILTTDGRLLTTWRPRFVYRHFKAKARRIAKSLKTLSAVRDLYQSADRLTLVGIPKSPAQ